MQGYLFKNFEDIPKAAQLERWEHVILVLEGLTPHERQHHWNMSVFGVEEACGTVACAAGHCGMNAWFRAEHFTMDMVQCCDPPCGCMKAKISDVGAFFGRAGALHIFHNGTPRTVKRVIAEVHIHIAKLRAQA